ARHARCARCGPAAGSERHRHPCCAAASPADTPCLQHKHITTHKSRLTAKVVCLHVFEPPSPETAPQSHTQPQNRQKVPTNFGSPAWRRFAVGLVWTCTHARCSL